MSSKPKKDEHKTAKTTEKKTLQNGAEMNVSEGESSAGVIAAALKEFRELIGSVKHEIISQMLELRNSIQGSIDALTVSVFSTQTGLPLLSKESAMWKTQFQEMSGPSVSSKKIMRFSKISWNT